MNQTVEKRLDGASVGDWIRNNTNLLLMFALIIVGALTSDNFFSMDNILNVLRRITVNGMLAVACTMTLLVGGFDLSIGHVMALSAVLCIGFEKSTGSGAVGIVVALAAGLVLGLINGLLMKLTRGGSGEGFMITLATGMMAQALAKWYCAGSEIIRIDLPAEIDWFKQLGQGNLLGFPICTLIWIAVMVILQIVIKKTTFGRQMLLTGANKKSAFLAGINVNRVKVIAYTVAGFCCGHLCRPFHQRVRRRGRRRRLQRRGLLHHRRQRPLRRPRRHGAGVHRYGDVRSDLQHPAAVRPEHGCAVHRAGRDLAAGDQPG